MKRFLAAAITVLALAVPSVTTAAPFSFSVVVDTSALIDHSSAPFSLDFQLIGGIPSGNTVEVSNFNFGGGQATGAPVATTGVSGDLTSSLGLDREQVQHRQLGVETARPQVLVSAGVDELCGNANALAGVAYAAFNDQVRGELVRDIDYRLGATAVRHHGRA